MSNFKMESVLAFVKQNAIYADPQSVLDTIDSYAMESLDKDRDFLTQGGVFTDDQIDAYIALKFEEIHKFEHAPHPVEFEMYYSS